jgi:hypothetical protein
MKGSVGYLKVVVLKGRNLSLDEALSDNSSSHHDDDDRDSSSSSSTPSRGKRMMHVVVKYEPAQHDTRYAKASAHDLIIGTTRSVPLSKNPSWISVNPMQVEAGGLAVEGSGDGSSESKGSNLEPLNGDLDRSEDLPATAAGAGVANEHEAPSDVSSDRMRDNQKDVASVVTEDGHKQYDSAAAAAGSSVGLMQRLVHNSYTQSSSHKSSKGILSDSMSDMELPGRSTILEAWDFYNVNGERVCVTNAFKYPVLQSLVYSKLKGYSAVLPWDASPASVTFEVAVSKQERRTIVRQLATSSQNDTSETIVGTVKVPFSDFVKARLGNRLNPIQRWYKICGGSDGTTHAGEILLRLQVDLRQATEEICRNITGKGERCSNVGAGGEQQQPDHIQNNPIGGRFRHNPLQKLFFFQKNDSDVKLKRRERQVLEEYVTIHNETIEEMILSGGKRTGMMGQFYMGLEITKEIQNMMGNICGKFESFQNWLNWTDPERTFALLGSLALAAMTVLWTVRSRYIILLTSLFHLSWGLYRKIEALSNGYIQTRRTGKLSYSRRLFNFVCGTIPHNEDLRQTYQRPNRMFRLERNEIQWRMRFQAIWHGWLYVREGGGVDGSNPKFEIRHVIIRNDRILWWKTLADVEQHPSEPRGWLRLNESSCVVQATKVEEHGAIPYTLPLCVMGVLDVNLSPDQCDTDDHGSSSSKRDHLSAEKVRSDSDQIPLTIPMQNRRVFLARTVQEKDTVIECLSTVFGKLKER